MISLKRQQTSIESDGRGQKRACSNRFPSNLVQEEQATGFQNSTTPSMQALFVVPKRCIHKIVTACNLAQATCCACLDARPDGFQLSALHGRTRLGVGSTTVLTVKVRQRLALLVVFTDPRREYWDAQDNLGRRHRRPPGVLGAKEDVLDVIRVSYGVGDIDITRSMDLIWDGLKAEVARLMRCHPSQLIVSDIAVYKGRVVPQMSDDNALTLATHIRFRCVTHVEPEDDEMGDVQYD
ncbi:hypothetical protein BU25DRAFT_409086 [Macroventuria anomochaeta]|uniref:Uncharacterized protein n=1 Tax=Macroventuria anomochaeta TaxID=301207 RepID=A0ACB6S8C8_9PLEO|nr:uncharacterized protein BU25DRAFT_409086 [Macroventuria anomochaeta]KAF2629830.1 hypothetical protein BU25DRAFT_409086 [Macroventuria anomochaeta]